MRWEWRDMIRTRDWAALEALARSEPGQQLCDTIHELACGLDCKKDVRSAKRILYFLRQSGFCPTSEKSSEPAFVQPTPLTYGLIGTTNARSFSEVGYVTVEKNKVRWLHATASLAAGCVHFKSEVFPRPMALDLRRQMLRVEKPGRYLVEAPPDYCLRQIRSYWSALKISPGGAMPDDWRETIEASVGPQFHPAERDVTSSATARETASVWRSDPMSSQWQLLIHRDLAPKTVAALEKTEVGGLTGTRLVDARLDVIREHREEWRNPRLAFDALVRHLDMSWALTQRGETGLSDRFLEVAKTFRFTSDVDPFLEALEESTAENLPIGFDFMRLDAKHRLFTSAA